MRRPNLTFDREAFVRESRPRLVKGLIAAAVAFFVITVVSGATLSLVMFALIGLALYIPAWDRVPFGKYVVTGTVIVLAVLYPFYQPNMFEIPIFGAFPSVDTAVTMLIFIMMALGLNIVVGYAGLLDLGYVAFYAMGAYTAAWFASPHFSESIKSFHFGAVGVNESSGGIHVSIWIVLIVAAIFTAFIGVLIGLPTLRLRGDYLAIVTLGFGEIMPQIALNGDNLFNTGSTSRTARRGSTRSTRRDSARRSRTPSAYPSRTCAGDDAFWLFDSSSSSTSGRRSASSSSRPSARCGFGTRGSAARGSRSGKTRPQPRRWASR